MGHNELEAASWSSQPWMPDGLYDIQEFAAFLSLALSRLAAIEICQHLLKNGYVTWTLTHVNETHETVVKAMVPAW